MAGSSQQASSRRQSHITDYFSQRTKQPSNESSTRKRKADDVDTISTLESSTPSSSINSIKRAKRQALQSRSRLMVELALQKSPVKNNKQNNINKSETSQEHEEKEVLDSRPTTCVRRLVSALDVAESKPSTEEGASQEPTISKPPGSPEKIVLSPIKFHLDKPILKSPVKSPTKTTSPSRELKRVPAFQRLKFLSDRDAETSLYLPSKFKSLVETFSCLDSILALLKKQQQATTFTRVKQAVERMSRRTFDHGKLLQIKTVFPEAFKLTYESTVSDSREGVSGIRVAFVIIPTKKQEDGPRDHDYLRVVPVTLTPSLSISRKDEFMRRLTDRVKKHHEEFLLSLNPPIRINSDNLVKWHPAFPLEQVPDIVADYSYMPEHPYKVTPAFNNVNEALKRIAQGVEVKKNNNGTEKETNEVQSGEGSEGSLPSKRKEKKITSGVLKGISLDLLDKIRAKEAARVASELTRSPETEKKISMLSLMPPLIRTVRSYFVGERKTTLPLESVIRKVVDSHPSSFVSYAEIEERLSFLTNVCPDWMVILKVKKGSFVKILKMDKDIGDLEKRLNKMLKDLQESQSS